MVIGSSPPGFHLLKFFCVILVLHLLTGTCLSLNLEGIALMEFRLKIELDPHGIFDNWNPEDRNPCRWSGVHCVDDKVEMLKLNGLSLEGMLTPELGKLIHLKSLMLNKNNFFGAIPKEIGELVMLEILDLRDNKFSGTLPVEFGKLLSLKHLLLCNNRLEDEIYLDLKGFNMLSKVQFDRNCSYDVETKHNHMSRKVGDSCKSVKCYPSGNKNTDSTVPYIVRRELFVDNVGRRLSQKASNLPAASVIVTSFQVIVNAPSTGSGSFPAIPSGSVSVKQSTKPTELPHPNFHGSSPSNLPPNTGEKTSYFDSGERKSTSNKGWGKWIYIFIPVAAVVLLMVMGMILICRSRSVATIRPWRTGLSCQLQKAFVTGVPKLQRQELEVACEDFSNIVQEYRDFIVYKGILSSGVEIAVASTVISSSKDWSKHSETHFRKKIEILSRINHKNFVNLIGYCEEENPFMRILVFEYAPNGTLYEHLHVKELEHLDWSARMRIIMGITYCLQYMHHELNPPISAHDLQSNSIYLTDDYAAKIAEMDVWKEVIEKRKLSSVSDIDTSESTCSDLESNIYDFGVLLLEIISGKLSYSEKGFIVDWAVEYLNDKCNIDYLIDPTLKSFKRNELEVICEVLQKCVCEDSTERISMKEVAGRFREVLAISPESATPRLSPLWWAELEILSVEAA